MDFKLLDRIAAHKAETAKAMAIVDYTERRRALYRIAEQDADAISLGELGALLAFCTSALTGYMDPAPADRQGDTDMSAVASNLAAKIDMDALENASDVVSTAAFDIHLGFYSRRTAA